MGPSTLKRYREGTHRVCDPVETLARVLPLLPRLGITRVADITRLDRVGIPTYQAIRPNSRSLSVSQGKGLTPAAAKVSAIMESIESWHAERLAPPARVATVGELAGDLGYDVFELCHLEKSLLNPGTRLEWLPARRMDGSGETFVPRDYVSLDFRIQRRWAPPVFAANSNGLASGNTLEEAALHALCEVVERDGGVRLRGLPRSERRMVALETVSSPDACAVLDRLAAARMRVEVIDCTGPSGLPCFEASIRSDDYLAEFFGAGCHPDAGVALCRALTEAAQSRLTLVSGVREDVSNRHYIRATSVEHPRPRPASSLAERHVSFEAIASTAGDDVARDLGDVVVRVQAQSRAAPLLVDLTRGDVGVPVVKVVAPGLLFSRNKSFVDRAS